MSGVSGVIAGLWNVALDKAIAASRSFVVNDLAGRRVTTPVPLITANTQIAAGSTGANVWVNGDIGPEISVDGFTRLSLWFNFTRVDSTGLRFRCVGRHTSGGTNHTMPIYNPSVAATPYFVAADSEYIVMAQDISYNTVLTWDIANTIPFVQLQMGAATNPTAASNLLTGAYVTYGWGS